jgi:hypothetical protein
MIQIKIYNFKQYNISIYIYEWIMIEDNSTNQHMPTMDLAFYWYKNKLLNRSPYGYFGSHIYV